jgi:aldehyde dehydrogenase (NAD+)
VDQPAQEQVARTVDRVKAAQAGWQSLPATQRAAVLHRAAELVPEVAGELALAITTSVGKPIREARAEVDRTATVLRFAAGLASAPVGRVWRSEDPSVSISAVRGPVGTVAMITPFNFPVVIPAWKLGPALMAGNTVAWKPAPAATGAGWMLLDLLRRAGLPDGVCEILDGDAEAGRSLVDAGVDAVTFTGSTGVGRSIGVRCAELGIAAQLELGGKNTALVLPDADLRQAAADIALAAFGFAGQKCTATGRVLVCKAVADEFTDLLAAETERVAVGDPLSPDTVCGPVISARKAEELRHVVDDLDVRARADSPDTDRVVAPRLLTDIADSHAAWTDELFGPILPLRVVDDLDEGLDLVNRSAGGLAAGVHTSSSAVVHRLQRELRSGVVAINRPTTGLDAHVPFGGIKGSSAGPREQGPDSLLFFTEERTVYWRESTS